MDNMYGNKIGLAGEFRVMAELLLRGHNPAKSYLEQGADIVLENNLRIEIKSAHKCNVNKLRYNRATYTFALKGGARKKKQNLAGCDFVILWCIDDDNFLIIPTIEITKTVIAIDKLTPVSKYFKYKNAWDLLEVK